MLLAFSLALAFDTKKLPNHDIFLDDGQRQVFPKTVQFGVVGNVRAARAGEAEATRRVAVKGATTALAVDVSKTIQEGRTEFLVLMGNLVPGSSLASWKGFAKTWLSVIAGGEPSEDGYPRTRVFPVAGEDDGAGDDRYTGYGAIFPGATSASTAWPPGRMWTSRWRATPGGCSRSTPTRPRSAAAGRSRWPTWTACPRRTSTTRCSSSCTTR
jgi:hypothetical protein